MEIHSLKPILQDHPFFEGMSDEHIEFIIGCASNIVFDAERKIFCQDDPAEAFYLIREGKVAIEVETPGGWLTVQTLDQGGILGWSWLFPPHQWQFDAYAIERVRAIALDGRCLRGKCEESPTFGYELMKRFSQIIVERLHHTRLQLMDIYGHHN